VNNIDAFTGMVAEAHASSSDLGELQRAVWTRQFQELRDGDRFWYQNGFVQNTLNEIRNRYGIEFQRNLGDIIAANTDIPRAELAPNVFFAEGNVPPTSCRVRYQITTQWPGNFQANVVITNTGTRPIPTWTLRFRFTAGQEIYELWNGVAGQSGANVPVTNASFNASIAPGQSRTVGFNARRNDAAPNPPPANITLNTTSCTVV
jgi:hypothetical protein